MKVKITAKDGKTRVGEENETQWGENITHRVKGRGNVLCSDGVIHYYESPELAVFANPIHGNFDEQTMLLWEFKPKRKVTGDSLKSACKEGTTIRQVPKPLITMEQRTEIAIKLALLVYKNKHFKLWAKNWLNNQDRSANAARYAADAADAVYAAQFVSDVAIKININSIIQEVLNESN